MTTAAGPSLSREGSQFAETVAAAVARHPTTDPWTPGAMVDDRVPELEAALNRAGWDELAGDPELLALAAPAAAAELGRGFAALAPLDRLLGGAFCLAGLARYAQAGEPLARLRAGGVDLVRALELRPLAYTDALGVAEVAREEPLRSLGEAEAEARVAVWIAGSVGYLAGMAEEALRLALEHTRSRVAFGAPLAELEPVQQLLADAATLSDGLTLLCGQPPPGPDALAHAGAGACRAVAACQQVTGALGFTLDFPLQRAQRRVTALRAWADLALDAWEARR